MGAQSHNQSQTQSHTLAELVSLHEIASVFASTHDYERLLDLTMEHCLRAAGAESGSIQIYDEERGDLVIVRGRGIEIPKNRSPLDDPGEWAISKRVFKSGEPLLLGGGDGTGGAELCRGEIGSAMSIPLKCLQKIVGVVNLNRGIGAPPFSEIDLSAAGLLASQAGIAINNSLLYKSLNYRLDELTLICNFSESLMGLVDQVSVIKCLFGTVRDNFPIDFIGFLLAQKRGYEFLYWSRGKIGDAQAREACERAAMEYKRVTSLSINPKRVYVKFLDLKSGIGADKYSPVGADGNRPVVDNHPADNHRPDADAKHFGFEHIQPVVWENVRFGSIVFAANKALSDPREKITILSGLVNQTRIALINTRFYNEMKENYIRTIKALAIAVDAKDKYTYGHSENVQLYSEEIALEMGMGEKQVGIIRDAGLLHDIGKIGIPGYILNKPGPLTSEEFNGIMKNHSVLGANILKDVPFLQDLHKLVLHHHEHYDGAGYPQGLKGEEIPIGARIIHLADAFEAMTADRPYRSSLGTAEAIRRIQRDCGKQFDPGVVEAFMNVARRKKWVT
jgi:putative nucleotidyltransferase with HDIG domain